MIPTLAAVVLLLLERMPRLRLRAAGVVRPSLATDVGHGVLGFGVGGLLAVAYLDAAARWMEGRTLLASAHWDAMPFTARVAIALVALDLGNYVAHWMLHASDVLWRFHEVHHSSRHLDWVATFRSHLVEQALRRLVAPLGLLVLGVPPADVGAAAMVFLVWAMTNHANLRLPLGPLEGVFITPRLHHLHHAPATTERNLGTVFTWWDRLRGTLVVPDADGAGEPGLPRGRDRYPQDWVGHLLAPFRCERAGAARDAR